MAFRLADALRRASRRNRKLNSRLERIAELAAGSAPMPGAATTLPERPETHIEAKRVRPLRVVTRNAAAVSGHGIHPAARKLLTAAARHAPGRFTWGQLAILA